MEIVNVGSSTVSLAGFKLSDDEKVRHNFAHDAVLHPNCSTVDFDGCQKPILAIRSDFSRI